MEMMEVDRYRELLEKWDTSVFLNGLKGKSKQDTQLFCCKDSVLLFEKEPISLETKVLNEITLNGLT